MRTFIHNKKGQTLIEAVVALAILILVLSASAVAVVTSLDNSRFTKNQNLANKYSQQGIEYMRDLKSGNFAEITMRNPGSEGNGRDTWCLDSSNVLTTDPCTPNINAGAERFIRQVLIDNTEFQSSIPVGERECVVGYEAPIGSPRQYIYGRKVTVQVKWNSGKCDAANQYCHKAEVVSCFMDPTN